mgnify:CR=1 FL=1
MTRADDLAAALEQLVGRVRDACHAADRAPDSVRLLPVTKFFPASDIEILYGLGCREFGESREQEASGKVAALANDAIGWHMIGRLQRNKARAVAKWASTVHSVDDPRLVAALDSGAGDALAAGTRSSALRVLLQVSLDDDPARGGATPDAIPALAESVAAATNLELGGVMAIPPLGQAPERAYERLALVHEDLLRGYPKATDRSAGMSGDLEVAVRYGSTCVRVGTALMGARPIN